MKRPADEAVVAAVQAAIRFYAFLVDSVCAVRSGWLRPPKTEEAEAVAMAAENRESWDAYGVRMGHHLERLRPELKRALLRRTWNQHVPEIARRENISESLAKRRLDVALGEVFDTLPKPVHREGYSAATWVMGHLGCCLAAQVEELKEEARA